MREKEARAWSQLVEEELLLTANPAVITVSHFPKEGLVGNQLIGIWEGDSVNALRRLVLGFTRELGLELLDH